MAKPDQPTSPSAESESPVPTLRMGQLQLDALLAKSLAEDAAPPSSVAVLPLVTRKRARAAALLAKSLPGVGGSSR